MLHPTFFDQRYKQRTCLLSHRDASGFERPPVCVAADGRIGADDDYMPLSASRCGGVRSRFDDTDDFHARRCLDFIECQSLAVLQAITSSSAPCSCK